MVPLTTTHKEKLQQLLLGIYERQYINLLLLESQEFEEVFDICITCNEIEGIRLGTINNRVVCLPLFSGKKNPSVLGKEICGKEMLKLLEDFDHTYPDLSFTHRKLWEKEDFSQLEEISLLKDPFPMMKKASEVAQRILERSRKNLSIVCGPISSGTQSVEKNLKVFNRTIFKMSQRNQFLPVFNQMPFEPLFGKVHALIKEDTSLTENGNSSKFFIDHFYENIFRLRNKIWHPYFISGWQKSIGATIEHTIFSELGAQIEYLEEGYEEKLF